MVPPLESGQGFATYIAQVRVFSAAVRETKSPFGENENINKQSGEIRMCICVSFYFEGVESFRWKSSKVGNGVLEVAFML